MLNVLRDSLLHHLLKHILLTAFFAKSAVLCYQVVLRLVPQMLNLSFCVRITGKSLIFLASSLLMLVSLELVGPYLNSAADWIEALEILGKKL